MIRQRVNAGLKRAVEAGKQLGRPLGRQLRTGKSMLKIAIDLSVGSGTVQRVAREMRGERPFDRASAAA